MYHSRNATFVLALFYEAFCFSIEFRRTFVFANLVITISQFANRLRFRLLVAQRTRHGNQLLCLAPRLSPVTACHQIVIKPGNVFDKRLGGVPQLESRRQLKEMIARRQRVFERLFLSRSD